MLFEIAKTTINPINTRNALVLVLKKKFNILLNEKECFCAKLLFILFIDKLILRNKPLMSFNNNKNKHLGQYQKICSDRVTTYWIVVYY